MAIPITKQTNIAINEARNLVFFEGEELCFNYKTGQWTEIPAYNDIAFHSLLGQEGESALIGTTRFNGNVVHIDSEKTSDVAQTAVFNTGAQNLYPLGRAIVKALRPRVNGGTYAVRVGTQDNISDSVTWSSSSSVNSRSGAANFRSEGRYHRVELTISGGFDTAVGIEGEWEPKGRV